MCTVTLVKVDQQTIITMNRDEAITRLESQPRMHALSNDVYCWYPVDEDSNGTWFGVNNHGLVLSILNFYQAHNPSAFESRGQLIPHLLKCTNIVAVIRALKHLQLAHFSPFTLLIYQHGTLHKCCWNGAYLQQWDECLTTSYFITSSSIDIAAVTAWRSCAFTEHLHNNSVLNSQAMIDFHFMVCQENPSFGVNMTRKGRHTKSISQLVLVPEKVQVSYYTRLPDKYLAQPFAIRDSIYFGLNK